MGRHRIGRRVLFGIVLVTVDCSRGVPAGGWDGVETVITNVAVVSVEAGTVEPKRAIAVRDGRIDWIGGALDVPTDIPAAVIDGGNAYVIPGLIDLHVHTEERDFPLYLTAGVTTVLFKHGDTTTLTWRAAARSGELLAPRIYTTGPVIAGREIHWPHVVATSAVEADARVREQLAAGYDFIKVYDFLSSAAYDGLAAAATEMGIRFIGHTPDDVGLAGVLDAGQHCIDHADQLIYSTHGRQASMEVTAEEARAIAEAFAGHETCFTSTLFGMKALMARGTSRSDSLYARPEMAFVDQGVRRVGEGVRRISRGSRARREQPARRSSHTAEAGRCDAWRAVVRQRGARRTDRHGACPLGHVRREWRRRAGWGWLAVASTRAPQNPDARRAP